MSAISVPREVPARLDMYRLRGNYLTTSDVARLCGVSRFTVINWANKGRIKVIKTVGGHRRIHALDAMALARGFGEKEKASSPDIEGQGGPQKPAVNGKKECGNCLTVNEDDQCTIAKKKEMLRGVCYAIGRGAHIFRRKAKN